MRTKRFTKIASCFVLGLLMAGCETMPQAEMSGADYGRLMQALGNTFSTPTPTYHGHSLRVPSGGQQQAPPVYYNPYDYANPQGRGQ